MCRLKAGEQALQSAQEDCSAQAAMLGTLRSQFKAYQAGKSKEVCLLGRSSG